MSLFGTNNHTLEIPNPKSQTPNPNLEISRIAIRAFGFGIWDLGCGISLRQPEGQFDGRATGARGVDSNPSLMRQDNLLNDGEAETGSARSRGEERVEDLLTLACRNARSVILDGDAARAVRVVDSSLDDDRRRAAN